MSRILKSIDEKGSLTLKLDPDGIKEIVIDEKGSMTLKVNAKGGTWTSNEIDIPRAPTYTESTYFSRAHHALGRVKYGRILARKPDGHTIDGIYNQPELTNRAAFALEQGWRVTVFKRSSNRWKTVWMSWERGL